MLLPSGVSTATIQTIPHDYLGFSKKSTRLVLKLLNDKQKQEGVSLSKEQVATIQLLKYPSNQPDLVPGIFSPFRKVKDGLAVISFNVTASRRPGRGSSELLLLSC